jgi:signal transduction histidine kinase/sensor domain CHASE-containing protein
MTLRAKTLLLIGSTLMGLVIVIYGGASFFLRRNYANLERQLMTADANRARKALQETITAIDRTTRDYALWDDTYAFVQTEDPDYIEYNFIDDVFIEFGLNLVVIFDADGRPLFARAFDLEEEVETALPPTLLVALQPYLSPNISGHNGILLLPDLPLLLAARPILPSVDPLPANGVLVMGRYLDAVEIARLASIVELTLAFEPIGHPASHAPPAALDLLLDPDPEPTIVEPQQNQTVTAYSLINDINQEPALLLTVTAPRSIYQQGLTSLRFLFWGLLFAGMIFSGVGLILVERLVLARIALLTNEVVNIGQTGDTQQRAQISGNDELSQLAESINGMIARLDGALVEQEEARKELQQNLRKTTLLNRVIATATATRDPNRVMELVCEELGKAFDLPQVALALLNDDTRYSRVVAEYCAPGHPSALGIVIPVEGNPLTEYIIETQESVYIANVQTDPRYQVMQAVALERGTVSMLLSPLIIKGYVVGTLGLNTTEPREFSATEIDMVESVVRAISRALENARLYTVLETELHERRRAEEALQKAKAAAEAANLTKSEFVSVVSHELRVPLTAIQGFADLMAKGVMGTVSEAQTRHLQTIINNVSRLNNLITDLTDISRIETGRVNLHFTAVDLHTLIEEALQLTEDQIKQRDHTLEIQINGRIPPIWGDRDRLIQILTNLISNAYKYTPNGGHIILAARPTLSRLGPQGGLKAAQITIKDNGIGIRPEDQQQLFQRFFRAQDEQAQQLPGTGLGLSIVKNLLEIQGGRIWFESDYGKGTTFHFIIPLMDQLSPLPVEDQPSPTASVAVPLAEESPLK